MKRELDNAPHAPPIKALRFKPKIPQRKVPKREVPKNEPAQSKDDFIDKELLSKLNSARSQDGSGRRIFKNENKVTPVQVAFGDGDPSKARTFGNPNRILKLEGGSSEPAPEVEKEYVEPWDYSHSYYPITLPLRRPHSGNPEILDQEEFRVVPGDAPPYQPPINAAAELGLLEEIGEPQMLFFQLPANLPLWKRPAATSNDNKASEDKDKVPKKGCRLEELPAGLMGTLQVYKSGKVKLKLGDSVFDVSPGAKCMFAQDVAAIDTKENLCCVLGEVNKRAVITPDVDSLLNSINGLNV